MRERIAQRRASGEGRADDSEAVGEQRIKHFVEQTMPVVDVRCWTAREVFRAVL